MIDLDALFTSLGIVGGNPNSKGQYNFYKTIFWNDGDVTRSQYDFFKKVSTSRYEFFKQYVNEREFYRSIDDVRIYDYKTFYEYAGEYLSSPDWILKRGDWNDIGAWFDEALWID